MARRTYVRAVVFACRAHCECGATWRVYADENDEDPKGTCVACGTDTYDLRGVVRSERSGDSFTDLDVGEDTHDGA
jgi:hypothetical protein